MTNDKDCTPVLFRKLFKNSGCDDGYEADYAELWCMDGLSSICEEAANKKARGDYYLCAQKLLQLTGLRRALQVGVDDPECIELSVYQQGKEPPGSAGCVVRFDDDCLKKKLELYVEPFNRSDGAPACLDFDNLSYAVAVQLIREAGGPIAVCARICDNEETDGE